MSSHSSIEAKIRTDTTTPTNPVAGDMYYDTSSNVLHRFNGSYWSGIVFGTTTSTSTTTTTSTSTSTSTSTTSTSSSTSTSTSTSTTTSTTTTI